jgi:putative transposase
VVGYHISERNWICYSINTLKIAIKNRKYPEKPLIHHSDRGFQYCNPDYTETLDKNNIGVSMTTNHDPYENAVAEKVNGILKNEFDLGDRLPDQKNAERELNKTVWVYNNLRPHESCSYLTHVQAHNQESIEIKKFPVRFRKKQDQNILSLNQLCHTLK